ncbi:MAG TPA: NifB/NifX family molybdenum-iron cluster-binding protein [Thermoleophilia bacterium]|nr:NifB/NifX family molybdenum-iron cluster-binding protein [Thermoleophilia bacterium]
MKVVITAQGNDLAALVDPRFGRARWLIALDTESGQWAAVDNRGGADADGGSGALAGALTAARGADAVITGNVGPTAGRMLGEMGARIYQAGNGVHVQEALALLKTGELPELTAPTVAGHWSRPRAPGRVSRRESGQE